MPMIRFEDGASTHHAGASHAEADAVDSGTILLAGHGSGTEGLALALEERGHDVVGFTRFAAASRRATRVDPDTVLVGGARDAGDALQFLFDMARVIPHAVRIALTEGVEPLATDRALAAGAHDVVCPPHSARAILFRRRILLRTVGQPPLAAPPQSLRQRVGLGDLVVDLTSREVLDGADPLALTGREFELLVRLMEASGAVVTRERLLHDIWGEDQGSDAVLDATVHRLRRKLDEKLPRSELVATVRGVGYRLEAPSAAASGANGQG